MSVIDATIYIIGTGLLGVFVGVIIGVVLGAEQILALRDQNERLKAQLEKAKSMSKTEVYEINVKDGVVQPNYFEKF